MNDRLFCFGDKVKICSIVSAFLGEREAKGVY